MYLTIKPQLAMRNFVFQTPIMLQIGYCKNLSRGVSLALISKSAPHQPEVIGCIAKPKVKVFCKVHFIRLAM